MSSRWTFFAALSLLFAAAIFPAAAQTDVAPDYTHANDPLPAGILAWDATQKSVDATNGQDFARYAFWFTNIAAKVDLGQATNLAYVTNFTTVTNTGFWSIFSGHKYSSRPIVSRSTNVITVTNSVTPLPVTILSVHPSCGCTTAEVPAGAWLQLPGTNGVIRVNVNLAGKSGQVHKSVAVSTDKGRLDLILNINIQAAPPAQPMSDEERARGIAAAKLDRQAVFRGDCVNCHAKNVQGKMGQQLFIEVCAVCHEAKSRASMVPDLHNLKDPTSDEFWRAWITSGKAGTLMPAFAKAQGGPLDEMQVASLATYLNTIIPPHAPAPAAK